MFLIILGLLIFVGYTSFNNNGKLDQLRDTNNKLIHDCINEKVFIDVDGCRLGMFIIGENINKPVLLFLHGGPGCTEIAFLDHSNPINRLESLFTVVYLDQRGSGLSNPKCLLIKDITIDKMIEDTIIVSEYLIKRFNKEKIYLMGHSWGTFLAIKVIEKAPNLFNASINVSQIVNNKLNERKAYFKLVEHAQSINDKKALELLSRFSPSDSDFPNEFYLKKVRTKYLDKYGYGLCHKEVSLGAMMFKILLFEGYTIKEKNQLINGISKSQKALLKDVLALDISSITSFKTNIYFMQGEYDYQTNTSLVTKYYDTINANDKGLFIFKDCAHSPLIENKKLTLDYLKCIVDKIEGLNEKN